MIIHLKEGVQETEIGPLLQGMYSTIIRTDEGLVIVTPSSLKQVPVQLEDLTDRFFVADTDIQLASSAYKAHRTVDLGHGKIGGGLPNTTVIIGPCSVESREQIEQSVALLKEMGLSVLRAGSFKPRTSPYTFQGLATEGLELLAEMREKYGIKIITEARDATHIDQVIEYADIIQVGAKAMYDQGILRRCATTNKPVLIKRGFGTTLQEFVQAAEFVLSGGNSNVILCERGIRTFETKTRFTLDLCGVSWLKENTNLPIVLDPSHAIGFAYGVPDLARACMAMGVEGLLIEVHPDPANAKSDAAQQLNHQQFRDLFTSLKAMAPALNRNIF
ncbi:MAG: 3-deoxy-7-phosphoheptulonate synthase [Bacteroidales bacterium]